MTQPPSIGRLEFVNETALLNGGGVNGGQGSFALVKAEGMKRSSADAGLDMECADDSDSDSDSVTSAQQQHLQQQTAGNNGLKPGKKTKGRVKIKMEFIENKLRRYTTFSKRKTGIMKKAYELSTLTGTQVMLLVASETGHVYTFATRKLQPMITSESGKALIQTCLNSPDAPPTAPGQQQAVEQRMNPTGFEETELSYAVGEEEQQKVESMVPSKSTSGGYCHVQQPPSQSPSPVSASSSPAVNQPVTSAPQPIAMTTYISQPTTTPATSTQKATANISMQLPSGGIAVLPSGGEAQNIINYMQGIPPGTPISLPVTQASSGQQQQQQQAVYRFPTPQPGQIVSLQGIPQPQNLVKVSESSTSNTSSSSQQQQQQQQQQSQQQQNVTMIQGNSQGPMMYHTSQGLVYAAATGAAMGAGLPEGFIVNLPQTSALQLTQDQQSAGGQQYITIPVPLSLAHGGGAQQMFQPMLAQTGTPTTTSADAQRSPTDRSNKR